MCRWEQGEKPVQKACGSSSRTFCLFFFKWGILFYDKLSLVEMCLTPQNHAGSTDRVMCAGNQSAFLLPLRPSHHQRCLQGNSAQQSSLMLRVLQCLRPLLEIQGILDPHLGHLGHSISNRNYFWAWWKVLNAFGQGSFHPVLKFCKTLTT